MIPYFLKKKTCTKYFFNHIIKSKKLQNDLIFELKIDMPKYILYKSEFFDLVSKFFDEDGDGNITQDEFEKKSKELLLP